MKKQFYYAMSASVAVLVAGCGCGSPGASGGDLAVVNNEPITMDQYYKYMERKPSVQVLTQNGQPTNAQVASSIGFQTLRDLIQTKLVLQIAKDEGVFPTQADIEKELKFQQALQPDYVRKLQAAGLTMNDIREAMQLDLAQERIVTKGITVTQAEAKAYIDGHKDEFSTPAQARLLIVAVNDDKTKAQVDSDLAAGKPFGTVAAQYSTLPNARQNGGQYPETVVGRMPAPVQTIVKATAELRASDWKKDPGSGKWVKFFVQSKTDPKPLPIDDTRVEFVQRGLAKQRGMQANDLNKRIQDKMRTAKIDVQYKNLQDPWKQAYQSFSNQQTNAAQSPTTPATTGGVTGTPGVPTPTPGGTAGATPGAPPAGTSTPPAATTAGH